MLPFLYVDGKQNANGEMATRSREMREKEKRGMRFPALDFAGADFREWCGREEEGRRGKRKRERRTAVGKVRQPEQLFPGEISLSAGLVPDSRDIQRNSGQRSRGRGGERGRERKKMNETCGDWWRGMWRREKSRAETVRRDKRGKKWVNHYFAFAFAGSDIDSRQPEGTHPPPTLSSFSSERTARWTCARFVISCSPQ